MNTSSVLLLLLLFLSASASGQSLRAVLKTQAAPFQSIPISAEVSELGPFSSIANAVFKPPGAGPFPAVVIAHSCGGVNRPHIRERMRELLGAGFVVLAVDSFGPRGFSSGCGGSAGRLGVSTTVMDAYTALDHLGRLAIVDASRIYATGYSWGALVTTMLASPQSGEAFASRLRFRALVSNYGACSVQRSATSARFRYLQDDSDRPLLMLMAGEDREYKPADCFPLLEDLKAAGKAVAWHVYADTHHAWDQRDHNGSVKVTTGWGEVSVYLYNAEATRDSTRRMIEFFNSNR